MPNYVREIQTLLSKMEVSKKLNCFLGRPPFMGRPYISTELAMAISNLYCLKYIKGKGITHLPARKLRGFLLEGADQELFVAHIEQGQQNNSQITGSTVTVRSVIQVMKIYRDELITPPRRKTRRIPDDIELLEGDTDGASDLEDVQDILFQTTYLPQLSPILDWFIATRPILDKNQRKRGWIFLEKSSQDWHQHNENTPAGIETNGYLYTDFMLNK